MILSEEAKSLFTVFRDVESRMPEEGMVAGTAESSHLDPQASVRDNGNSGSL
ncbi:hypothetical protein ACRRTK_022444 [Alexandromys fortis]